MHYIKSYCSWPLPGVQLAGVQHEKQQAQKGERGLLQGANEHLWANLTKGRCSIPDPGIPSDWSILTGFVKTQPLLTYQ